MNIDTAILDLLSGLLLIAFLIALPFGIRDLWKFARSNPPK